MTTYDKVASLLIALLILVGLFVATLFVMWLKDRVWVGQVDVPVEFIEPLAGGGSIGDNRDLEEPGDEELEDLTEPQLEETLDAVTDAITAQRATLESLEGEARSSTAGNRGEGGDGTPGEGGNANIVPRFARWEILFSTTTLDEYARQLDAFGIELGVAGGGSSQVEYAYHLTKRKPDRRVGKAEDEKRIYMTWRQGRLKDADKTLLARAGISTTGKIQAQFFPPALENMLAKIERDYAPELSVEKIAKTVFGLRPVGTKYEFYVVEQRKRG